MENKSSNYSLNSPTIIDNQKQTNAFAQLFKIVILALIFILAFACRLYSVLRYESMIHEFDPYFNYRTTQMLVREGFYNFINWFDQYSWYPLGRIVGGTVFPGLMVTAGFIYWILNAVNITVNIRNICVLLAPFFASNTTLATYFLTKEVKGEGAGLFAAAFIATVPAYISRSVAGSYDNEGVAIFALIFTFYLWVKAVKTGSLLWSCACTLAYFYMVAAWGGYVFITNLIPLYTFICILSGRYSGRLYIAYSIWYVLGTLLAMQVTFVGFQAVTSSEHFASFGTFGLIQLYAFLLWIKSLTKPETFKRMIKLGVLLIVLMVALGLLIFGPKRVVSPWTGRFYSMFDPTYAKEHIPIIASVSEHQPTTWSSVFFDLHILTWLFPAGLYFCFKNVNEGTLFVIIYGVTAIYFVGIMIRLMLVLAPIACILGGIAVSETLNVYLVAPEVTNNENEDKQEKESGKKKKSDKKEPQKKEKTRQEPAVIPRDLSFAVSLGIVFLLATYAWHSQFVISEAYSSPSIVLLANRGDSRVIFDDFREAFRWLKWNTAEDARIMSWWDYGYQITAMGNRTVLVDNNTWNNTHIATVGRAMCSTEAEAYKIMLELDVDYVLIIFGGVIGYSGDDINKFLWMVRIAGGVWPHIKEKDYFSSRGEYRIDSEASPTMLNSLMYKLSYYRFGQLTIDLAHPAGFDRVRNTEIGNKKVVLNHLEEAYTTEHWLVRIYKVSKPQNHDRKKKPKNKKA